MLTLTPHALLAQDTIAGSEGSIRILTIGIVVVLVVFALRTVGRALEPIVELARSFVAASMAVLLMLAALVLAVVVAVGYV
jgi:hypothetical protein